MLTMSKAKVSKVQNECGRFGTLKYKTGTRRMKNEIELN
jgi:hypothetical protein